MDLRAFRQQAETFVAELGAAYHAHYAGRSEEFAIDAIYSRHAGLFSFEAVEALRSLAAAAGDAGGVRDDEARRLRMLLDFAVEGLLGRATATDEEALAQREATLRLDVPGGPLGFRESSVAQANEPSRERRAEIEAARLEATERELNPLHRAALERTRALVAQLGWPSYRAMCAELKGWDLDLLGRQGDAFLAATSSGYEAVVSPALERTVGVGLERLARADLPWFFRARADDDAFPAAGLLEAYAASCRGLGLSPDGDGRIDLDVEPRPRKSPRAFCVAVRAPGDVRLVVAPVGGRDDYAALLHEGGHAQHFAAMGAELPFEYRHLGDNALTEAFAFLFDHLAEDPHWLAARGVRDDGGALAVHARAARLDLPAALLRQARLRADRPRRRGPRRRAAGRGLRPLALRRGRRRVADRDPPERPRPRLLRRRLPARLGAGDPPAPLARGALRPDVVRLGGGGRGAARTVGRGSAPQRRGAARRPHRRAPRPRRAGDRPRLLSPARLPAQNRCDFQADWCRSVTPRSVASVAWLSSTRSRSRRPRATC